MKWISRRTVMNQLGVPEPVLNALVSGGLLGYTMANMVSDQALLQYERFGTQWTIDERRGPSTRVMENEVYESMPSVKGIGPQPPATQTHGMVAPPNSSPNAIENARRTDVGWIAYFYLYPNYFYFPSTTELSLIWPPPLKLPEPRPVPEADLPVALYQSRQVIWDLW